MKFNNLSIWEKIGCIVLVIVCIILLFNVSNYSEGRFKNTGFEIENNEANNAYNDFASKLMEIGYIVNMVNDDTYDIYGNFEKENIVSDVILKMDKDGNVKYNIHLKLKEGKDDEYLEFYDFFNSTLKIFDINLSDKDFKNLIKDAINYSEILHGVYESENCTYEIYENDGYINIVVYN